MPPPLFTIGHSNHTIEQFVDLLQRAGIERLIDVRSIPASRRHPQFNRASLSQALASAGIGYDWQGAALGGRPGGSTGPATYESIAAQPDFREALTRVAVESVRLVCVLMCAEREPLDCHRTVLVGSRLGEDGIELRHVHADGAVETHAALEDRLLTREKLAGDDLLSRNRPRAERVRDAWARRGRAMSSAR